MNVGKVIIVREAGRHWSGGPLGVHGKARSLYTFTTCTVFDERWTLRHPVQSIVTVVVMDVAEYERRANRRDSRIALESCVSFVSSNLPFPA